MRDYRPGDIVTVKIQVESDSNYGYWVVIETVTDMMPDGSKTRVRCLSPCGTVVSWSPHYLVMTEVD